MRALKALVIVMGVLILAGMGLVGYVIVKRSSAPPIAQISARTELIRPPIAGTHPYGPIEFTLPKGAEIANVDTDKGMMLVEASLEGGGQRIYVIELASGALIGTFDFKPQP